MMMGEKGGFLIAFNLAKWPGMKTIKDKVKIIMDKDPVTVADRKAMGRERESKLTRMELEYDLDYPLETFTNDHPTSQTP